MPEYNCTVLIGENTEASASFNYECGDSSTGLEAELIIHSIGFMKLNSIDCIMCDLSFDCVERIRVECFKYVEVQRETRA